LYLDLQYSGLYYFVPELYQMIPILVKKMPELKETLYKWIEAPSQKEKRAQSCAFTQI
jgi:hypothetical protein